jgi:glycerol kinase
VAEVSAVGAAKLGWQAAGEASAWREPEQRRRYHPAYDDNQRWQQRNRWRTEIARARFSEGGAVTPTTPRVT